MKKEIKKIFLALMLGFTLTGCGLLSEPTQEERVFNVDKYDSKYHWKQDASGYIDQSSIEPHIISTAVIQEAQECCPGIKKDTCSKCAYTKEYTYDLTTEEVETAKALALKNDIAALEDNDFELALEYKTIYDSLSENAKTLVDNVDKLNRIVEEANKDALVKQIITAISKLTENDIDEANRLKAVYDDLDADLKAKITNYSKVETVIQRYNDNLLVQTLLADIAALKDNDLATALALKARYEALADNLKTKITTYSKVLEVIENNGTAVTEAIETINLIELIQESEEAISAARQAYNALSSGQKSLVTNYNILQNAENLLTQYKAIDINDTETQQQAIINAAFAYLYRGTQFQYDQYTYRRNPGSTPEAGNDYNWTYLDCSGFCNTVYQYTFGENIIDASAMSGVSTAAVDTYAKNHINKEGYDDVIYYGTDSTEKTQTDARAAQIRAMLQPGDVYNYRHGDAGHIMLYIGTLKDGNDYFLHSTGSAGKSTSAATTAGPSTRTTEDQTDHEKYAGTIVLDKAEVVFEEEHSTDSTGGSSERYIFTAANTSWSILRPLKRMAKLGKKLNSNAIARLLNPTININKSSTLNNYHSIVNGGEITYTVKVNNVSTVLRKKNVTSTLSTFMDVKDLSYTYIEETLPSNVEFVSASDGGVFKDNKITWLLDPISSGNSKSVTYTVKAKGANGAAITDSKTYVNGLQTSKLQNNIKANVDIAKVVEKFEQIKGSYTDITQAVAEAYKQATGIDFIDKKVLSNASKETSDAILYDDILMSSYAKRSTTDGSKLIPNMMYGGIKVRNKYNSQDDKVNNNLRNMDIKYLEPGDIISCEFNGDITAYFVASSSLIYGLNDSGKIAVIAGTSSAAKEFAHTVPYFWGYAVCRPSLSTLFTA